MSPNNENRMKRFFWMLPVLVCLSGIASADEMAEAAKGVREIVAHRGSCVDRPECTLSACRRAIEAGATAVEVDVRSTKDGKLVLLHDETLDRTTNGTGRVGDRTLAEIKTLDAGSWFDARFKNERVPTLAEVLMLCRDKCDLLLDLKEQGDEYVRRVAAEVKQHGDPKRIIVGGRSVEQVKQFRALLPEARFLGLIPETRNIEAFAAAGCDTIRLWPKWLGDETLVPRVRRAKVKLHIGDPTGSIETVSPLLKHRPDSMSSDDPARLKKSLAELQSADR
jgi:glycerophosphoryl diester phosphodiesterase